jgi:N utilization substance protein B
MLLIIEISDFAKIRIEHARQKNIQNSEDINPNTKFIDNRLIHQLSINSQLNHFVQNQKLTWSKNPDLIKNLYYELKEFEPYKEYMANESKSYIADKKIVSEIFSKFFLFSESLDTTLEEESIYWNDDIEYIVSMILKTIKQFRADDKAYTELLPLFRDEEDEEFAKKLFRRAIFYKDEHRELINSFTQNWEVDRIAFIDILILQIAITEIVDFESIPIRVSFNEYIELSKLYSTKKSSNFINGILDNIIKKMKKENKFKKTGRGLLGE